MPRGKMTYARAELKRRIGVIFAVIRHDRGSREKVFAARARNNPSRRGTGRNGTWAGYGAAHTPQDDNGNQDCTKEVRRSMLVTSEAI